MFSTQLLQNHLILINIMVEQSYNATYSANGLVDILKLKIFLKKETYGKKTLAYICKNNYIDIDYPQDLNYAKFVMSSKKHFKL